MHDKIKDWVVNDYFTPNIKAEVILDTLLTPYIEGIIKDQCDQCGVDAVFVTKEMSVFDESRDNNQGEKIDYILADAETVYLVELKTTKESIKPEQALLYQENCFGKNFGEVFGDKLLKIVSAELKGAGKKWKEANEPEERLGKLFNDILQKYGPDVRGESCAGRAKELLKLKEWDSTKKYLYTMGQLLDYLHKYPNRTLWNLPLKLIYITLNGEWPHPTEFKQYSDNPTDNSNFYLHPKEKGSVSLKAAVEYLNHQGDELAGLLADIIKELPDTKKKFRRMNTWRN